MSCREVKSQIFFLEGGVRRLGKKKKGAQAPPGGPLFKKEPPNL